MHSLNKVSVNRFASGYTTPSKVWGYNPVEDDRSDFTQVCIPRQSKCGPRRAVHSSRHNWPGIHQLGFRIRCVKGPNRLP